MPCWRRQPPRLLSLRYTSPVVQIDACRLRRLKDAADAASLRHALRDAIIFDASYFRCRLSAFSFFRCVALIMATDDMAWQDA